MARCMLRLALWPLQQGITQPGASGRCSQQFVCVHPLHVPPVCCCCASCCLPACRSIELRFRLPGVDLWTTHKPMGAEVCLMFMLLGAGAWLAQVAGSLMCVLLGAVWGVPLHHAHAAGGP